jgi:hypothetical protein
MSMSSEELHGYGREVTANCRENQVVLESSAVSKWRVSDDDYEVYILCFVLEDRLKPSLVDEFVRRLASRDKIIVALC